MKIFSLFVFLIFSTGNAFSQIDKNNADVEFLYKAIQKLPSYKDQVKTNPALILEPQKLKMASDEPPFKVFLKLYSLISPIRDNHLSFYSHPDSTLTKPEMLEVPKAVMDIAFQESLVDSVCGTYYAGQYTLSIVKIGTEFVAVIPSEGKYYLQFILKPTTPNHFDFISFSKGGAGYTLIRNMVYANGRLVGTPYKKYKKQDFISLPKNTPKYEFRTIDEKIAYLRLGSFYADNANIAESKKFFGQISISKNIKHLIVDLRDNGGGGYKTSKRFLDLIKSFNGKVHLLTNSYTVSNAEQFTVDLMDDRNVIRYGETTRGTISYGSNTDVVLDLPSKRFKFYITDMTNRNKDLPFESYGIEPQIKLDPFQKDWVAQVIEIIKQN